ncbi:hypothetical protein RUM43_005145 [Polyplax serrata]|uniref:Peroxisomal multifunctional enzyme type 2 n=1 Tax=Polyplax serrata TaxID=468196 RepID=A0AAN8SBP0_POLSC
MPEELRFDGRVAVVTGAGAGLGRSYALLLASRGAAVVVNDLGGGRHGDGSSSKAADAVVNEIRAAGGKAVGNYDSVEDGEKIIKTAIDNFGRIDILINNAGILRDKSFAKISDMDWDLIHRVHLKGSFKTTQAAWPYFKKQKYGRIIMTSSNSGIFGNFGQANYSSAKMGLIGLSNTLAIEGEKSNITCNVIVPTAASRLTEDILPPDFYTELKPELIAPVVGYLCHESCSENGSVFDAAAGWAGQTFILKSKGGLLRTKIGDSVTIENVRDNWAAVTDMTHAKRMKNIQEASFALMSALEVQKENEMANSGQVVDYFKYSSKDLILYALGVGCSVQREEDLRYLYENHEDFGALPSFLIIPGQIAFMTNGTNELNIKGKSIDVSQVLHGEQYLEIYKQIPCSGCLESRCRVVDVLDKGKGALMIINFETFDESGEKVAFAQMGVFVVGGGGFGGPRNSDKTIGCVDAPKRSPDSKVREKTDVNQAALYRLSGDLNPLHIDSNLARISGFQKPILHGLASFGFSVRHVLKQYANNDGKLLKAVKARFAKPVVPGQTLETDMWREGNRIHFQTKVVESENVVLSGGYVDLHSIHSPSTMNVNKNNVAAGALKTDGVFEQIGQMIKDNPDEAKKVNAVFAYKITNDGKIVSEWTVDLKKKTVYKGSPNGVKADTTITISDDDMADLVAGKLNAQQAFLKGKLKVAGNIMLADKLRTIMVTKSKL